MYDKIVAIFQITLITLIFSYIVLVSQPSISSLINISTLVIFFIAGRTIIYFKERYNKTVL